MLRALALVYGFCCLLFFLVSSCLLGYFLNSAGATGSPGDDSVPFAWLVNCLLLVQFGLQHSGMARPGFKRVWTRFVPPAIERSTYVLCSSAALVILCGLWQPMPGVIWDFSETLAVPMLLMQAAGIGVLVLAGAQMDPWELLGLRQVIAYARGQPELPPTFRTLGLYRWVRHPLMLGLLIFLWATPYMTLAHLLFCSGMSLYIFIGIWLEERTLLATFGEVYADYRRKVPMLLPGVKWS